MPSPCRSSISHAAGPASAPPMVLQRPAPADGQRRHGDPFPPSAALDGHDSPASTVRSQRISKRYYAGVFRSLFSTKMSRLKMISTTTIVPATMAGLKFVPMTSATIGIAIEKMP